MRRSIWGCLLQLFFTACALVHKGMPPHVCLPIALAGGILTLAIWRWVADLWVGGWLVGKRTLLPPLAWTGR